MKGTLPTLLATGVGLVLVLIPEPASTATGLAILATTFAVTQANKGKRR